MSDNSSVCPENAALSLMDSITCAELLNAKDHCCMLAFMLYLWFYGKDVNGLIEDLRRLVLDVDGKQSNAT